MGGGGSTVTRYHLSSPCVFGNFCSRVWNRSVAFSGVGSEGEEASILDWTVWEIKIFVEVFAR